MTEFARRMKRLESLAEDERMRQDAEKLAIAFDMSFADALDWRRDAKRLEAQYWATGTGVLTYAELAARDGVTEAEIRADAEHIRHVLDLDAI